MISEEVKKIVYALLLVADEPLAPNNIAGILSDQFETQKVAMDAVGSALVAIEQELSDTSLELRTVASGVRIQVRPEYSQWVERLWEQRPPSYSRALMETLALIAYRQPVTRGDIEKVRGVATRTNTIRTLLERGWIKEIGKRQVPGLPALFATTNEFLDYFNLQSLDELPEVNESDLVIEPRFQTDETEDVDQMGGSGGESTPLIGES